MNQETLQQVPPAVRAVLVSLDASDEIDASLVASTEVPERGTCYRFEVERAASDMPKGWSTRADIEAQLDLSYWPDQATGTDLWFGCLGMALIDYEVNHTGDFGDGGVVDGTLSITLSPDPLRAREQCLRELRERRLAQITAPLVDGMEKFTPELIVQHVLALTRQYARPQSAGA
jgi:hypothetical protein